jgi:histidinol-phosphate aminotransferase
LKSLQLLKDLPDMQGRSPSDVVKSVVRELSAYTLKHRDAEVKLDQNENPYELPDSLKREIVDRVLTRPWGRYPEFVPAALTRVLSRFTGWPEDGILVGNGSNELIQASLSVTLGPGRTIAIPQPTFTLYRLMSSVLEARQIEVLLNPDDMSFDVDQLAEAARHTDVLVICSPNNPTGTLLERDALVYLLKNARGLILLDEAYHEFSGQSAVPLLKDHSNLAVLRTLSKAMSLAGLRFGYMLAHPEVAREVHKAKLPYNVNIFTLTAAQAVIENRAMIDEAIGKVIRERGRVMAELQRRPGVKAFPTMANFILLRTEKAPRSLFEGLYKEGVLTRDVSSYPLLEKMIRVTIGRVEENDRFLQALDKVLENA